MTNFETNKMYNLQLDRADPQKAVYLGIKKFRIYPKHVFLVYNLINRSYLGPRFYLGKLNETTFEKGIVKIEAPESRFPNALESKLLHNFIEDLKNQ